MCTQAHQNRFAGRNTPYENHFLHNPGVQHSFHHSTPSVFSVAEGMNCLSASGLCIFQCAAAKKVRLQSYQEVKGSVVDPAAKPGG